MSATYESFTEVGEMLDVVNSLGQLVTAIIVICVLVSLVFFIPYATYRYAVNYSLESSRRQDDSSITLVYGKAVLLTLFVFIFCCEIAHFIFIVIFGVYDTLGDAINEILMLELAGVK